MASNRSTQFQTQIFLALARVGNQKTLIYSFADAFSEFPVATRCEFKICLFSFHRISSCSDFCGQPLGESLFGVARGSRHTHTQRMERWIYKLCNLFKIKLTLSIFRDTLSVRGKAINQIEVRTVIECALNVPHMVNWFIEGMESAHSVRPDVHLILSIGAASVVFYASISLEWNWCASAFIIKRISCLTFNFLINSRNLNIAFWFAIGIISLATIPTEHEHG